MDNQQPAQRKSSKPVIGITHGNINGVSYEILIKTFSDSRIFDFFTPVVYGSSKVASYHRKVLKREDFSFNLVKKPDFANARRANIINITDNEIRIEMGRQTEEAANMSILALDNAFHDIMAGGLDALVSLPVGSKPFKLAKTRFRDFDDYLLASLKADDTLLFIVNDFIKIGFVTGHIPFKNIAESVTEEMVHKRIGQMHESLVVDFGVPSPRIAVLSLNPHCEVLNETGEEEKVQLIPAIKKAVEAGLEVHGPYAPDRFFGSGDYKKFDGILALYHDQGLLPFRTISDDYGVLYYSGLPCVVTQPAQESSLELAGKGEFSPDAARNAMVLAARIVENQRRYAHDFAQSPVSIHSEDK